MNRILITVYILFTGEEYDMFVPIGLKVSNVIDLIQKTVNELDNQRYVIKANDTVKLFDEKGNVINENNIVKFSGLKNGSKVVLI